MLLTLRPGEYELIQNTFDIGVEDIIRLIDNGFSAAFLENHVRRRLRAEAMHCALSILHEVGIPAADVLWCTSSRDHGYFPMAPFNMLYS